MKYYIIAGESSGDKYGAALMHQLSLQDKDASFRFWGGKAMMAQSPNCDMSIEKTSFMGLLEVLLNIHRISALFSQAKTNITAFHPDMLILIDYPGFNLRIAKWASRRGLKVAYYISPQIWAWRKYRYRHIKKYTSLFFPVLPFEQDLYKELGVAFDYYGHPLVEHIGSERIKAPVNQFNTIGLFPGSRLQEVQKHIPVLASFARQHPEYRYILSVMDHLPQEIYGGFADNINIHHSSKVNEVMQEADVAFACSGTLTLELALCNIPQIVIYRTSASSYTVARRLINIKYISLVNLILDKPVIRELIQSDVHVQNLSGCLHELRKKENLANLYTSYAELRKKLGDGRTSAHVAERIISYLEGST